MKKITLWKRKNAEEISPAAEKQRRYEKCIYFCMAFVFVLALSQTQVFAATTVWDKAKEILKDVYNQIVTISTIVAVVTAAIAMLFMNFSKSGKTVDEARAWLKRIAISWAVINGLGFIMAYIVPFFKGGKYNVS